MHVKKTLDEALLAAGVQFLYSCYATDVLRDAAGKPCGIVMANRAGRQAVVAKTIIDATDRALVARLAGREVPPLSGRARRRSSAWSSAARCSRAEDMTARVDRPAVPRRVSQPGQDRQRRVPVIEYTLQLPMADDSYAAWAAADQQARTLTYHPEQQFTSDVLFQVPPDAMHGRAAGRGPWQGVEQLPLGAFQPGGRAAAVRAGRLRRRARARRPRSCCARWP